MSIHCIESLVMGLGSVLEVLYAAVNNKHVNINSVSVLSARTCPFLGASALTSVKIEALGTFTIYAISITLKTFVQFHIQVPIFEYFRSCVPFNNNQLQLK